MNHEKLETIDVGPTFSIIISSALLSANILSQLFLKKLCISEELSYENVFIKMPSEVDHELEEEYIGEYMYEVNNFIQIIKKAMPDINLDLFYKNIKTVKFRNFKPVKLNNSYCESGGYDCNENTIFLPFHNNNSIYHELLHLSSFLYDSEADLVGFRQSDKDATIYNIGVGLNEGYTAVLGERLFKKYLSHNGYIVEKNIAIFLEIIIGSSKMTDLYFTANLHGLIEELNKYSSLNETFQFLKDVDFINNHIYKKMTLSDKYVCQKCYEEIIKYLVKCFVYKQKEVYEMELSTIAIYTNLLNNNIDTLYMKFKKINNYQIKSFIKDILNEEKTKKVVK